MLVSNVEFKLSLPHVTFGDPTEKVIVQHK